MADYSELIERGIGIRDESQPEANSAQRVGQYLLDVVGYAQGLAPDDATGPAAGGAPQWQPGPQTAGALVYDLGIVYRVKVDRANSLSAPAGNTATYEPIPRTDAQVVAAVTASGLFAAAAYVLPAGGGTPTRHATAQAAHDAAAAGDTLVLSGYHDSLSITKSLTVTGGYLRSELSIGNFFDREATPVRVRLRAVGLGGRNVIIRQSAPTGHDIRFDSCQLAETAYFEHYGLGSSGSGIDGIIVAGVRLLNTDAADAGGGAGAGLLRLQERSDTSQPSRWTFLDCDLRSRNTAIVTGYCHPDTRVVWQGRTTLSFAGAAVQTLIRQPGGAAVADADVLLDERPTGDGALYLANAVAPGSPAGTLLQQLQWLAGNGGTPLPTPAAPTWSFNSQTRVLSLSAPAGYESAILEYKQGAGSYQNYTAGMPIDGAAHAADEWQGRVKAVAGQWNAGTVAGSPALSAAAATPLNAPVGGMTSAATATSQTVTAATITNATGYKLFGSSSQNGTYSQLGSTLTTTNYAHTGLAANTIYWYKWQALGNGTTYADSLLSDAFSGQTQPATAYATTNVTFLGNSLVEGTYGTQYPSKCLAMLGENYLGANKGIGGSRVTEMNNRFAGDVTATKISGKNNYAVVLEGTNTLRYLSASGTGTGDTYFTQIRQYCLDVKAAGYDKVLLITTPPSTVRPGVDADANPGAQTSNTRMRLELAADGIVVVDLAPTLIGKFGTAPYGADAGFSSYLPDTGSALAGVNRYFAQQDLPNSQTHLSDIGYDVLARIVADYILYVRSGTPLPDRSTYGAPTQPVITEEAVVWKNASSGMSVSGNSLTQAGGAQWAEGASTTRGFGLPDADGWRGTVKWDGVIGGNVFIGLSDVDSGFGFDSLDLGIWMNPTQPGQPLQLIPWQNGVQGTSLGTYVGGARLHMDIYTTYIQLRLADGTNIGGAYAITLPERIMVDTSFGNPGVTLHDVKIIGPNLITI